MWLAFVYPQRAVACLPLGVSFGSFVALMALAMRLGLNASVARPPWRDSTGHLVRWVVDSVPVMHGVVILAPCVLMSVWAFMLGAPVSTTAYAYDMLGMSATALLGYFYSQEPHGRRRNSAIFLIFTVALYAHHFLLLAFVDPGLLSADTAQVSLPLILLFFFVYTLAARNTLRHVQMVG